MIDVNDPRLRLFSTFCDRELKDPHQLVGLARAIDSFEGTTRDPERFTQGFFIAESQNVAERALASGCIPFAFLCETRWWEPSSSLQAALKAVNPDLVSFPINHDDLQPLTGLQETRGPLTAFFRPELPSVDDLLHHARRLLILEDVTNGTNVGALFRSAAALGADGVLLTPRACDPLSRRVARVSMGSVFQIPWARIPAPENPGSNWLAVLQDQLDAAAMTTCALALTDQSISIEDPRLKETPKLALIVGTEGTGLQKETIQNAHWVAKIPMTSGIDSLNVATAGAIALWETRLRARA